MGIFATFETVAIFSILVVVVFFFLAVLCIEQVHCDSRVIFGVLHFEFEGQAHHFGIV